MPDNIFYSWQSDRPNRTNRTFIEGALAKAIRKLGTADNELYAPARGLKLDKDTKGVPGSPSVPDTIFQKIEECAVFVPDLTFCGLSDSECPIPNANVLIEYGWALAKLGRERIVAVMNDAYGEPTETTLPFHLRHTRWPHRFTLSENADKAERSRVQQELVRHFEGAIAEALAATPSLRPSFTLLQAKSRTSSFLDDGDILGVFPPAESRPDFTTVQWRDGPQAFLRVIPDIPAEPYSVPDINKMLDNMPLKPFWSPQEKRPWRMGNQWGVVVFESGGPDRIAADYIVQVTRQGEIWGIDNFWFQSRRVAQEAETLARLGNHDIRPQDDVVRFFEDEFARALRDYLRFAKDLLKLTSPVTVIAGFTGIQGFQTYFPPPQPGLSPCHRVGAAAGSDIVSTVRGVSLEPEGASHLQFQDDYVVGNNAYFRHAYKELIPFFVEAWNEFQYPRPVTLPKLRAPEGTDRTMQDSLSNSRSA